MNRILIVSIGLLLLVALPVLAEEAPATGAAESGQTTSVVGFAAGQAIPAQRVAVMEIEYRGRYAHELRKWLPALIEARLAEHGWTVLARGEALEAIRQEQNLPGVDPTTAPPQNKLYGASAILKLTARVDVKDYDAAAHIGIFSLGGLVKVKFYLNGQIIDAGTGVIRPLGEITSSKSKLKGIGVVFPSIGYVGAGYKISGIRDSLVGAAADDAAEELVKRVDRASGIVPGYEAAVPVEQQMIKLAFPAAMRPAPGAQYGIYRRDRMIAKVRVIGFEDGLATCRVLAATDQIRSTDVARPLEIIVPVEVSLHLDAKATAPELNPALFAEWAARREAVAAAREANNLDALLELLTQEVTDPLPAELPHWPSNYTLSEMIQGRILQGLSQTPEDGALVEAYVQVREDRPMEKRVVIALGLAGLVSLGEKEKEADDQTVLKRCLALLGEDKNDFIRARAARSLWHIVQANADLNLIPQVEPGLRAALKDEAGRPNTACNTAYGKTVYIVRAEARSALLVLGLEVAPGEVIPYSD